MNTFERQFAPLLFKILHSQTKKAAATIRQKGVKAGNAALDTIISEKEIGDLIQEMYKKVAVFFANDLLLQLKKEEKGFGFNAEFIRLILEYFSSYLFQKVVVPIAEHIREELRRLINQGIKEGWGADRIAMRVEAPEMPLWRARMIVRTEAIGAMNYGNVLGESRSNFVVTKRWIAADDHRTRHSHHEVDDTVIDFERYFAVPIYKTKKGKNVKVGTDYMFGPGDKNASAGNVINCRCALTFRGKRDARTGRLIRKTEAQRRLEEQLITIAYRKKN